MNLKPCPFCDGKAKLYNERLFNTNDDWIIKCINIECGCTFKRGFSKAGITDNWNHRPIEDDLREQIKVTREIFIKKDEPKPPLGREVRDGKFNK